MKFFSIICRDKPKAYEKRPEYRPAHLERIKILADEQRLITAGPLLDDSVSPARPIGSLVVAAFESQADAEKWCAEDPYSKAGIFDTIDIQIYKAVLP